AGENATDVELEARLVASRLRELRDGGHRRWDSEKKEWRLAEWRDMVVLLRSPKPKAEHYLKEFARAGIPLQAERGGLFDSAEVSDLLSLLQILDNPLQDVPLLAVLRSPLGGLSLDELSHIRAVDSNVLFWAALQRWRDLNAGTATETARKVQLFLERFARWRRMARHCDLSEQIECALQETHYLEWLLTQSRPVQRQANVRRFISLAGQFDPMQRQGLQRFLRFVDAQRDAETDSEPEALEDVDAVRLMSIHKSKGLEFPIVALAGLNTRFNFTDISESILLDERYGLCPHVKPPGYGSSYPSLPHWLAAHQQKAEKLGEEMRLLYVAMTRARDTLLLFGTANLKAVKKKWPEMEFSTRQLQKARCPLDWLGPWLAQQATSDGWDTGIGATSLFSWRHYDKVDTLPPSAPAAKSDDAPVDSVRLADLARRLQWKYPWEGATRETAKLSVTALRQDADEADGELRVESPELRVSQLSTLHSTLVSGGQSTVSALEVGTAHHVFLQMLDLHHAERVEDLRAELQRMREQGVLTAEQAGALDLKAIAAFWNSDLGRRLLARRSNLHREVPFTSRFTREDLIQAGMKPSVPENEFIVVQGTIDLALIVPEEIWIVDFKTDRLSEAEIAQAVTEYAPQLRLYGSALGRIYRRPVTALWLHFLSLGRGAEVESESRSRRPKFEQGLFPGF
ncbi:MAG: PD-(D/E)XK nuclease family protein, partial [Verrucomicrobia subdivision 3 bacterium]|nr:PD-(D/E)XK nuclease family protein [Limisphaerales bacterium]